jgi:alpha-ketoglutarate-dependent taurine dioxygenase
MRGVNTGLTTRRITSVVGTVIEGVNLREPLSPQTVQFIRQVLLESGVVFFHNQELDDEQMNAFVSNFGRPIPEPFAMVENIPAVSQSDLSKTKRSTSVWHSDTTFVAEPPGMTALRAVRLPEIGGDTCWSCMYSAYEALSEPMRRMLDGLTAVHSMMPVLQRMGNAATARAALNERTHGFEYVHPVVSVHPHTRRKALFVNEGWVTRIVELSSAESTHVLAMLFEHVKSPEFFMRWRWAPNDLAVWDNRSVQHFAVPDYKGERVMQRVVLAGERPEGPRLGNP